MMTLSRLFKISIMDISKSVLSVQLTLYHKTIKFSEVLKYQNGGKEIVDFHINK